MSPSLPQLIFGSLAVVFLTLASVRWRQAGRLVPQARAWLIVGAIFAIVTGFLWFR